MLKNKSSETAEVVAASRAMESKRPDKDRVIYDPHAEMFLGPKWLKWVKYPVLTWLFCRLGDLKYPGFRGSVIARVCFMNQCIKDCFPDEFTQLVILGAGYDMSAFYFQDILSRANVFEVDHPHTQNDKLNKIKEHIEDVPDNITYVPVNFETDDLKTVLVQNGYSVTDKTLFLCEGVIYFLEREAVEQTFDFVVENSGPGSKLAFDFFPPEVVDGTSNSKLGREMYKLVTKIGEPYKFCLHVDEMNGFLEKHHFVDIQNYTAMDIRNTHFHGSNKDKQVSSLFNCVCATT